MQPSPIDHLTRAVTAMHGSPCSHVRTVRVHEVMDGKTVWEGNVEVFDLAKHPKAKQAFAWSYKDDHGETQLIMATTKFSVITTGNNP